MRNEFANAGLPAPRFSVVRGEFKVTMKNGFLLRMSQSTDPYWNSVQYLVQEMKLLPLSENPETMLCQK